MKAMILAAGKGERMRPLTEKLPKPLLAVGDKPLIVHHLQALARAGIKDVIINTWYLGEQIIELIGVGARFGLNINYSVEDELMDTGGGIYKALPLLGNEPFLVISADIFTNFPFATLPATPNGLAHLVMVDNPEYHADGDFALDKGKLKLHGDKLTYANIGIYRPEFFAQAPGGKFPLGNLMRQHIANDLLTGQYFNDVWFNIGTPADLEMANNFYTNSTVE
jgi:MurNAc alpha-1-phosphate uridylyltransferase